MTAMMLYNTETQREAQMAATEKPNKYNDKWFRRRIGISFSISFLGIVTVGITEILLGLDALDELEPYRREIAAAELFVFGVIAVESAVSAIRKRYAGYYKRFDLERRGMTIRAVVRVVIYTALGVAVVSLLAQNAALAISVGSFTGIIIGFAAQTTIGNAFAGMVLAIARPFNIGDEVTIMGVTGTVVDIGSMFTKLDQPEKSIIIPNGVMLSQAIQRQKKGVIP